MSWIKGLIAACRAKPEAPVATGAFASIAIGCWWLHPSLGLIIPGTIVFVFLVLKHLRGG